VFGAAVALGPVALVACPEQLAEVAHDETPIADPVRYRREREIGCQAPLSMSRTLADRYGPTFDRMNVVAEIQRTLP
jgi:hypothetical protein